MNRLVTLGVKGGPSLLAMGAMPTSTLLDLDGHRIVIDAGLGVTRALVQAGLGSGGRGAEQPCDDFHHAPAF